MTLHAEPILHLSFPVRELAQASDRYISTLGGDPGRRGDGRADVTLFGAQATLQHVPADVLNPMPRSRHFGATREWSGWQRLIATLKGFVERPGINPAGTEREEAKAMIAAPSGNLVELKAYGDPVGVLGALAGGQAT